jgi:hypothetical protein
MGFSHDTVVIALLAVQTLEHRAEPWALTRKGLSEAAGFAQPCGAAVIRLLAGLLGESGEGTKFYKLDDGRWARREPVEAVG